MPNAKNLTAKNQKLRFLVMGAPGTGKSTFASTFPQPFYFDFDQKMLGLAGKDIEYESFSDTGASPKAWREFIKKLEEILGTPNKLPIETIVLDSFTSLQEIGMNEVQRVNSTYGKPVTRNEWGILSGMLNDVLYKLKGQERYHVVVVVHEMTEKDEASGTVSTLPVAVGKLAYSIAGFFHETYRCKTRRTSKGIEYYIVTRAVDNAPGNTVLKGVPLETVPDFNSIIRLDEEWRIKNEKDGVV